jgi:hypothetical protein
MGYFLVHGKNTYYERKRRKNGTDQHDEDGERTYDWPVGMCDHSTDQEAFVLRLLSSENTR